MIYLEDQAGMFPENKIKEEFNLKLDVKFIDNYLCGIRISLVSMSRQSHQSHQSHQVIRNGLSIGLQRCVLLIKRSQKSTNWTRVFQSLFRMGSD